MVTTSDVSVRRAIVTGGSSGIGYETAKSLALRGWDVTLTSRDSKRGASALASLRAAAPAARIEAQSLDLADLQSVRNFAAMMNAAGALDLLINNAGVMAHAHRKLTRDGFEMQLGTNHLGHFALTGLLLPALLTTGAPSRVVIVSSLAHRRGMLHFDDLQLEHGYRPMRAYTQSKLANLMFALELQRRLARSGAAAISVAAHPGISYTNLASTIVAERGAIAGAIVAAGFRIISQTARRGALPILFAATAPDLAGGSYIGPDGLREMRGNPAPAWIAPQACSTQAAAELWRRSEQLTGVRYLD